MVVRFHPLLAATGSWGQASTPHNLFNVIDQGTMVEADFAGTSAAQPSPHVPKRQNQCSEIKQPQSYPTVARGWGSLRVTVASVK